MGTPLEKKTYTYAEYCQWPEVVRYEIINGEAYAMSPAPSRCHQGIAFELSRQLGNWFKNKPCKPYSSPIDVFFPEADEKLEDITTVVQPDILVVCDESKLIDEGIYGAPDFIIEILSQSTSRRDRGIKRDLYERFRVREYWIVNPDTFEVTFFIHDGSFFLPACSGSLKHGIEVSIFPRLILKIISLDGF